MTHTMCSFVFSFIPVSSPLLRTQKWVALVTCGPTPGMTILFFVLPWSCPPPSCVVPPKWATLISTQIPLPTWLRTPKWVARSKSWQNDPKISTPPFSPLFPQAAKNVRPWTTARDPIHRFRSDPRRTKPWEERIGFSGTPSDLMPRELGSCDFEPGSEGSIVHTLTNPQAGGF